MNALCYPPLSRSADSKDSEARSVGDSARDASGSNSSSSSNGSGSGGRVVLFLIGGGVLVAMVAWVMVTTSRRRQRRRWLGVANEAEALPDNVFTRPANPYSGF